MTSTQEEVLPFMRVLTQEQLNGSSSTNNHDQTINVDALLKRFLPNYDDFFFLRNEFNKQVKVITDLMLQKLPCLTPLQAYKMFNAPLNYLTVAVTKDNLQKLEEWNNNPENANKNVPQALKWFYHGDNDMFFGKLTVQAVLDLYWKFCFEILKATPFQEIEASIPEETDPEKVKERTEKVSKKQQEWGSMMEPIVRDYISNHISPHNRMLRKKEGPCQPNQTEEEKDRKRRKLK